MRNLLQNGRGKYRSIMAVGPANCGKMFMLSALQTLFKGNSNPANDKYAWIGADKAECIFLNDFCWSNEVITWKKNFFDLGGAGSSPSFTEKPICKGS